MTTRLAWILSVLAVVALYALRARRRRWSVTREDISSPRARPYIHRSIGSRIHGRERD